MYICKNCGKEFLEKYSKWSNGDFCCKECARSYSTKNKRQEINEKVSKTLKGRIIEKNSLLKNINIKQQYEKAPLLCPICNNIILYERYIKHRKTCSTECGKELAKRNHSHQGGGYRKRAGRSKHGYYKGIYCDSTYELAYLIYCLDHNINIKRCEETFEYEYNGKKHKYHPDFIVNDEIIEIKGYHNNLVDIKMKSIINRKYKILYINDLFKSFEYVSKAYNKKFHNKWNNFYELYDE